MVISGFPISKITRGSSEIKALQFGHGTPSTRRERFYSACIRDKIRKITLHDFVARALTNIIASIKLNGS